MACLTVQDSPVVWALQSSIGIHGLCLVSIFQVLVMSSVLAMRKVFLAAVRVMFFIQRGHGWIQMWFFFKNNIYLTREDLVYAVILAVFFMSRQITENPRLWKLDTSLLDVLPQLQVCSMIIFYDCPKMLKWQLTVVSEAIWQLTCIGQLGSDCLMHKQRFQPNCWQDCSCMTENGIETQSAIIEEHVKVFNNCSAWRHQQLLSEYQIDSAWARFHCNGRASQSVFEKNLSYRVCLWCLDMVICWLSFNYSCRHTYILLAKPLN